MIDVQNQRRWVVGRRPRPNCFKLLGRPLVLNRNETRTALGAGYSIRRHVRPRVSVEIVIG